MKPNAKWPNHALQRTAPGGALAAADHPAACAHPAPATLPQPARRAPQSLSLGSFGGSAMSFALDIYYAAPTDAAREAAISTLALAAGGQFDFRDPPGAHSNAICLTFEFTSLPSANSAASKLRERGEHVEGPYDYGD